MPVKSLANSAVHFWLRDSSMTNYNEELTALLELETFGVHGDLNCLPSARFYKHGVIAAIRVSNEEIAIFPMFQQARNLIAELIEH